MRRAALGFKLLALSGAVAALFACRLSPRAQQGGGSTTTFGGMAGDTVVTNTAPENPQTPSTTTVKKTTERVYQLPTNTTATESTQGDSAREHSETSPRSAAARFESRDAGVPVQGASPASNVRSTGAAAPGHILRETVIEEATTQTGSSWRDTARELGVKLSNMRGVMWTGVVLLVAGPIVGWKLGWFLNGCIAGAVGLVLIILAQVVPGHEAWFGLGGLLLIPVVGFVYYRAHHDVSAAKSPPPPSAS